MTDRINEQKIIIEKVESIFKNYVKFDIVSGELESLGFIRTGGRYDVAAFENSELEIYVHISLEDEENIKNYEILTFDDIHSSYKG
ncbi:MAG: hypothetical protein PHP13_04810 [Methanomicrobium sp.]|nr:hypothetical protein [Methanomicrobium sp.]MDD4300453.1 hypothetical protein [Methanomicrobium sp.]